MQNVVNTNGHRLAVSPVLREKRPPIVVLFVGSLMTLVHRYFRRLLEASSLGVHACSFDTTSQREHDELPHLPDELFLNLADAPGVQQRLRAARRNPRIREWITSEVTDLNVGPGAAAEPLFARFLFENAWDRVVALIEPMLSRLIGPRRAESAAEARGRGASQSFAANDPIHVILVAGTSGATGSLVELVRLLLESLFCRLGADAKYDLILTLPSPTGNDSAALQKRRRNTCGRLQELNDSFLAREFVYQPSDDLTIYAQGPLYNTIYGMREPSADGLDQHVESTGEFLRQLSSPLGKAITDTMIDKSAHCRSPGPLGQPRFLSRVGSASLHAVPFEIDKFATAVLGMYVTRPATLTQSQAAEDFCRHHGLTLRKILADLPKLTVPDISRIRDKDAATFAKNSERRLASERVSLLRAAKDVFQSTLRSKERDFLKSSEEIGAEHCAEAVEEFSRQVGQQIQSVRVGLFEQTEENLPVLPPASASLDERTRAIVIRETALIRREVSSFAAESLGSLVATVDGVCEKAHELAKLFGRANRKYESEWRRLGKPVRHSVLTVDETRKHIERNAADCVREVRRGCWNLSDGAEFQKELGGIVAKHAETFRPLERIDEALRYSDEPSEEVLERVLAAAEPGLRVDPVWDLGKHASRLMFTDMPADHPLASALMRRQREVKIAASATSDNRWVFTTIDAGIEIGAITATREAVEAYQNNPDPAFPPFLDKAYRPVTRLLIPPPDEYYACAGLVVHRCLKADTLWRDARGWYFDGIHVGNNYFEAFQQLRKRENRIAELPSFDGVSQATRDLLERGRKPREVVVALEDIRAKLLRRLARLANSTDKQSARERLAHDEELAVMEALIGQYSRLADDLEADEEDWGGKEHRDA